MKLALLVLFISVNSYSQICNEERAGNLIGNNCLSIEAGKTDLEFYIATKEEAKTFCEGCNNPILNKMFENADAIEEKESALGKAVLDEFQKELTYISTDLMKMRSSFKLQFDPKDAVKSCNFKSNLIKPKCLSKSQSRLFEAQSQGIQNSLVNELSNFLSSSNKNVGLLTKRTNSCDIDDKSATIVQTRYLESLITPAFLNELNTSKIPAGVSLNDYFKGKKDATGKTVEQLKRHPLFKSLINDPKLFKSFINEAKNQDQDAIINALYSDKSSKSFAKDISSRCDQVFKKTSKYLNEIFCKDAPSYIADNLDAMESISGQSFSKMKDSQAESELKTFCAHLNNSKPKDTSFSVIKLDINGSNDPGIVTKPLNEFKERAYDEIMGDTESICTVMKTNECNSASVEPSCKMLNYYKSLKESPAHQALAKSSSDEINLILRSMIGSAIPQKNGQPDLDAIALLKSEGILPGGDNSTRPPQQDAGSFHRAVAQSSSGPAKAPAPQSAQAQPQSASSAPITNYNDEEKDESSSEVSKREPTHKSNSNKNSFSALSDEEQMNILNRMKPKAGTKKSDRNTKSAPVNTNDASTATSGPAFAPNSFTTDQAAAVADNTAVDKPNIPHPEISDATRVKLDPRAKDKDSFNEAKIQASQNRAPASDITKDTVISLSKTDGGLNKIEIKVPDESILDKKTPELEKKIQDYLDKSGQSLQGAKKGEAFIVKLGKYDIKVSINDYGVYVATCKDKSLHPDYLAFLSRYFTGIKERVSSSESIKKILQESK